MMSLAMISRSQPLGRAMTSPSVGLHQHRVAVPPSAGGASHPAIPAPVPFPTPEALSERVLCSHCGRTASNGITCQGICVADSGY
jgi:hypothetical protein